MHFTVQGESKKTHKSEGGKPVQQLQLNLTLLILQCTHTYHTTANRNASAAQVRVTRGTAGAAGMLDRVHNSAKSGAGFLDLGLLPVRAVAPFQSCINGIPQQNERTLQVVNKYCMTLQVYTLLAFQICSRDLVSRNVLPDSCKVILHNGCEK